MAFAVRPAQGYSLFTAREFFQIRPEVSEPVSVYEVGVCSAVLFTTKSKDYSPFAGAASYTLTATFPVCNKRKACVAFIMVLAHRYLVNGKRRVEARLTTERPQVCMPFLRVGKGRGLGGGVGYV